jgi:hypothetical protein
MFMGMWVGIRLAFSICSAKWATEAAPRINVALTLPVRGPAGVKDIAKNVLDSWLGFAQSVDQRIKEMWKPPDNSWIKHCVTPECVAGLPPVPTYMKTREESQLGNCRLLCNFITIPITLACPGPTGKAIADFAIKNYTKTNVCEVVCDAGVKDIF